MHKEHGFPQRVAALKNRINELAVKKTTAEMHLKLANETQSFTTVLRWRKADNFQACKREWESFWAFYWLYKDFPDHEMVENFVYAAFASANTVKHREKNQLSWEKNTYRTRSFSNSVLMLLL